MAKNDVLTDEELEEQRKIYREAEHQRRIMDAIVNTEPEFNRIGAASVADVNTTKAKEYLNKVYGIDVEEREIKGVFNSSFNAPKYETGKYSKEDMISKAQENMRKQANEKNKKLSTERKRSVKQIRSYWENAGYEKQAERKRWNEAGRAKAKTSRDYFYRRIQEVEKSSKTTFQGKKYLGNGKYAEKATAMTKDQYLAHCRAEYARWSKHYNNYDWGAKDAEAKMKALKPTETKEVVTTNSKTAGRAKKNIRDKKKVPQTVVNKANNPTMPKEVEDEMKKLGQDYKLITLNDSKGNNIYCFEKDGKHAVVMTQLKDQNPSKPMEVKSDAMNALVSEAVKQYGKKGADFTNVIGEMKVLNAVNEAERIGLSALSAQLNPMSMPDAKIKIHPTVTLVPKIKKNGKPSKKNFNIQLMDADGKVFILDKKTMEKAIKQQGNASATRGEMVDASWKNYVEQAKEGKLPPETVASFFKEAKPNIPQTQLTAVQMAQRKNASRNG